MEVIVQTIKEIKAMSTLKIIKDILKDKRSKILPVTSWQLTNRTMSHISRNSRHSICLAPVREIEIPDSVKFLLVESGTRGSFACGTRDTAQGIRNPTKD